MDVFVIPVADRALVRPQQYDFQTQVAIVANKAMGLRGVTPRSIPHHKGGVMVNGQPIVIDDNHVFTLNNPGPTAPTPEEAATAAALLTCIEVFKQLTAQGRAPQNIFPSAPSHMVMGHPLKQFFRHVP